MHVANRLIRFSLFLKFSSLYIWKNHNSAEWNYSTESRDRFKMRVSLFSIQILLCNKVNANDSSLVSSPPHAAHERSCCFTATTTLVSVIVFEACNWHPNHGEMSSAEDCICNERVGVPWERASPASGSRGVALHFDRAIARTYVNILTCVLAKEIWHTRRFGVSEKLFYAGSSRAAHRLDRYS